MFTCKMTYVICIVTNLYNMYNGYLKRNMVYLKSNLFNVFVCKMEKA